jgi:hypothetical protein
VAFLTDLTTFGMCNLQITSAVEIFDSHRLHQILLHPCIAR